VAPGTFHHLGWACKDLATETAVLAALGYSPEGPVFTDEHQGVSGRFLVGTGPRIELLTNLPGSSVLTPWLSRGVKVYHQAYVVEDLEPAISSMQNQRARLMKPPAPAPAFDDRRVCFVVLPPDILVELVERGADDGGALFRTPYTSL
jgi:methylmalonyl-CoA/ethylmalonyl-CoA epimerase